MISFVDLYNALQRHREDMKLLAARQHPELIEKIDACFEQGTKANAMTVITCAVLASHLNAQQLMFNPVADLKEAHRKFGRNYEGRPRALDPETFKFRLDFLREELGEYEAHMVEALKEIDHLTVAPSMRFGDFAFDNANFVHHLAGALDSLVDLVYVALGNAEMHGFDFVSAWHRVQHANLAKEVGVNPNRPNPHGVPDLIKPPGWEAPDHTDLVEDHAHMDPFHGSD